MGSNNQLLAIRMGVFSNYFFGHQKTSKKVDSIIFNWFPDNLYALKYNINNFFWYQDYLNLESYKIISRTFWVLAILALGLKSLKMTHFEFSESAILNFFLLHLSEKSSPFILGIIFSALWMVFPQSCKRSCPNFYAHDCMRFFALLKHPNFCPSLYEVVESKK